MLCSEEIREDLPRLKTPLPGPRAQAIIERDQRVLSPSYTRAYPLVVETGHGAIVEDVDGNRFLDFNAGIAVTATGHCHPGVVRAVQEQSARLIHMSGTDFYYENMVHLAEKLVSLAPQSTPCKVYFGNSGTEGMEAALKLARYATRRDKFISFFGGFHGRTLGSLSLTASKVVQKRGFSPLLPGVYHVPYPYAYRFRGTPEQCAAESIERIEQLFRTALPPEETAAIVIEPVQGEGGYVVPPAGFLPQLRKLADRHGILLIFDEVQCGMGRTGRMWACEHFGAEPDLLVAAKGIASGMPLSATIARAAIMTWPPGAHASTYGGNPVAVAASLATIDLLEGGLIENAARIGGYLLDRMAGWPERFGHIGEVRGLGLMIGIEFVTDQSTKEIAPELRDQVVQLAFKRGLLVLGAGPNTIRLCPPLIVNQGQADFAVNTLEECLRAIH